MYLGDNQPNRLDQSQAQYACIRTVVVDDEPIARSVLSDEIQSVAPEINIVGQAENGIQAIDQIQTLQPELVFLDVQMPGMDGFEVARQLDGAACPYIVFVTAYEHDAVRAFEAGAVDYLLKPVRPARLARCLARVRQLQSKVLPSASQVGVEFPPTTSPRKILGRIGPEVFPIDIREIAAFQAERELVWIITAKQRYLATETLGKLELKLASMGFARVHRSALVNLDRVKKMVPLSSHRWLLVLDSRQEFVVSKRQVKSVQDAWNW
jgi:two-component system LytT family response regulator